MNVREMKSLNLDPDEKRSLGSDEGITLKLKTVRNWFGKDKSHAGVSLEDASGEWISAAVFNAPTEIAKMEGEWIPIEPTPGQMSGVWLEGESYVPKQGPNAGKEVRQVGLKIMGGCFRWDKASQEPPGAPQTPAPAQGTSQGQKRAQGGGGAVQRQGDSVPTDRDFVAWLKEAGEAVAGVVSGWGDPTTPHGEAAVITTVGSILTGMRIGAEHGKLRLTYGEEETAARHDGPGEEERAAYRAGAGAGDDEEGIPFAFFLAPLLGALLSGVV